MGHRQRRIAWNHLRRQVGGVFLREFGIDDTDADDHNGDHRPVDAARDHPVDFWKHTTLPDHGIFNDPTMAGWQDYCLGDMALLDSPIADFNGSEVFPTSLPNSGQVNVYHVEVDGWTKVHFDAYGETINTANGKKSFWKSPFSHDGTVPVEEVTFTGVKVLFQQD